VLVLKLGEKKPKYKLVFILLIFTTNTDENSKSLNKIKIFEMISLIFWINMPKEITHDKIQVKATIFLRPLILNLEM